MLACTQLNAKGLIRPDISGGERLLLAYAVKGMANE